jgi:hypothetical protein
MISVLTQACSLAARGDFMGRYYPVYISVRKEHSLTYYATRARKDSCLYTDVEDFMAKHGARLDVLVGKLLSNEFALPRYTDPTYPF